jgi:nucleoside-diphosphate-sugar epimerase
LRRSLSQVADEVIDWVQADYLKPETLGVLKDFNPDYVVITLKPTAYTELGYQEGYEQGARNIAAALQGLSPKHIFYVSSTRVYAENAGAWVTEDSPLAQQGYAALSLIAAEQTMVQTSLPLTIVRFAGIYDGRAQFYLNRMKQGLWSAAEPEVFTNRIHRDDCSGFLAHLITLHERGKPVAAVYNGSDGMPVTRFELERYIAEREALPLPSSVPASKGPFDHKRISNQRLVASGYQLKFPSYLNGYQ